MTHRRDWTGATAEERSAARWDLELKRKHAAKDVAELLRRLKSAAATERLAENEIRAIDRVERAYTTSPDPLAQASRSTSPRSR
jgi:hypothetical protein